MTDEELQEMIDEADRNGDGMIDEDEFYRWGGEGYKEGHAFDMRHC